MEKNLVKHSKFLSLVLRHHPETIGLSLDEHGWVEVNDLLVKMNAQGRTINREELEQVVATNDKKRFAFSDDGNRIRANQGHSVSVDLALVPKPPPSELFHGTADRNLNSIMDRGILPGQRQQVHLSSDRVTAVKVGQRHGKPIVLRIDTQTMHDAGHDFFLSDNGVWLTANVPPEFVSLAED
ncbi:MAG: RNA 2'-phosphotransferase [Verrucomicrobiota bacterium]